MFATEWAIAAKALQPLPALHKDLNEDTRTRKPYIGMIADEKIRNMVRNRSKAVASLRKTFADHDFLEVETRCCRPCTAAPRPVRSPRI